MEIKFCGGAYEVGASCILLKISGKNIVMDCGMRMSGDPVPDLSELKQNGGVDLIIISHAHMDHIGTLPVLSNEFPNAPIIMTHMTKDLLRVLLYDSLKIMDLRETEIPIFSEVHVVNMIDRIVCYSPELEIKPFQNDIKVTMYGAGHIPGAAFVYLTSPEGSVFYSGDFSVTPQMAVGVASIPKLRPDVGIFESTYGNRLHSNRDIELNALLNKVVEVVSSGHKILIPAFALGRAQEIILFLRNSMQKGSCPKFKIYVDGMVNDICRVFSRNPNYLSERFAKKVYRGVNIFYNDDIVVVPKNEASRKEIVEKNEGCCIIASSGMLSGGPSAYYARYIAGNEDNFIALTGYQDEESPGAKLVGLATSTDEVKSMKLGDLNVEIKCGIGMFGLSAHADKSQVLALAHSLSPKEAFFVHGSEESVNEISSAFQKEHFCKVHVPQNGDTFYLDFSTNKRKQFDKGSLVCFNKHYDNVLDILDEDIFCLWEFVRNNYTETKGFTIEELIYVLTGKYCEYDNYIEFSKKLCDSKYFVFEVRRPYIFHAAKPEDIKTEGGAMEVNQALALANEIFAPFGLYKSGAKFDEKIIVLYFNFPAVATKQIFELVSDFEEQSLWKVQVNSEHNMISCISLIESYLSDGVISLKTPSYFKNENCYRVTVNRLPQNYKEIEEKFYQNTGLTLYFIDNSNPVKLAKPTKAEGQAEQNIAFLSIDKAFGNVFDKLYKKSLKTSADGYYIELAFISPQIGLKYQDLIDELGMELRWKIAISPAVNINEIQIIGKQILDNNGIIIKKNLSYIDSRRIFKANTIQPPTSEQAESASAEFLKLTGFVLEF